MGEIDKLNALFHIFSVHTSNTFSVEVLDLWPAQYSCVFAAMSLLKLYFFLLAYLPGWTVQENTCRLSTFDRRKTESYI